MLDDRIRLWRLKLLALYCQTQESSKNNYWKIWIDGGMNYFKNWLQPGTVTVNSNEPLTAALLASAPPQEQKQLLGERLFPLIRRLAPALAGKVTGMLLEIDNSELLHMLESPESLKAKVWELFFVFEQKNKQYILLSRVSTDKKII